MDVRVIPTLLLSRGLLYKTKNFKDPVYVGDPFNAIRIFNEKQVDELLIVDIEASKHKRPPDFELIKSLGAECFMPLAVGGGITKLSDCERLLSAGAEKVVINSQALRCPEIIAQAAKEFGASSVVASLDVRVDLFGRFRIFEAVGSEYSDPFDFARKLEALGAGELLLTSVDKEGSGKGYDLKLLKKMTSLLNIPVVANGGAGELTDFSSAVDAGAAAVAAGSMFVFHGRHRAVLISYPERTELMKIFQITQGAM